MRRNETESKDRFDQWLEQGRGLFLALLLFSLYLAYRVLDPFLHTIILAVVLWNVLLVGSIDNFVRPYLMRGEGAMSPFYLFLGIVGAVHWYGLMGLLYGPLIMGFARVMLDLYQEEYRPSPNPRPS